MARVRGQRTTPWLFNLWLKRKNKEEMRVTNNIINLGHTEIKQKPEQFTSNTMSKYVTFD